MRWHVASTLLVTTNAIFTYMKMQAPLESIWKAQDLRTAKDNYPPPLMMTKCWWLWLVTGSSVPKQEATVSTLEMDRAQPITL